MLAASKYTRGRYAVCSSCGSKPCSCPGGVPLLPGQLQLKLGHEEALPAVVDIRRRASGNAIPFAAFDRYPELRPTERLVLLYLCRLTLGYGHHGGDLISLTQLAERSGLSRHAVRDALNGLERRRLIERSRRFEHASKERGTTHLRVLLPEDEAAVEPPR